jgi:hypothetical protein
LVVVAAFGKSGQLVQIRCQPRCGLGNIDETVLDHRRLRVHAHDFIGLRLVAGDSIEAFPDQLLDQLGA